MVSTEKRYVVCLQNPGHEVSLELKKLYELLPDEDASQEGLVRVVDESEEDYLYPADWFVEVALPEAFLKAFADAG